MKLIIIICFIFSVVSIGCVFSDGSQQNPASDEASLSVEQPQPSRAEQVMKTLAAAYPGRIAQVEFRNDDWAFLMDNTWFYYASGRVLPENLREQADEFSLLRFYDNYPRELPPWNPPQAARIWNDSNNRLTDRSIDRSTDRSTERPNNRSAAPRQRNQYFHEALWQARNQSEASRMVRSVRFLGKTITVHSYILNAVSLVEEKIRSAAETDPQVKAWINDIGTLHGWNWRNVANSQSRSYHSYGIAIDILPEKLNGKET